MVSVCSLRAAGRALSVALTRMLPVGVAEGIMTPVAGSIVAPRLFPTILQLTGLPAGTVTAAAVALLLQTEASIVLAGANAGIGGAKTNVGCWISTSVML